MKSDIILTLIAPDRPGLVGRISDIVAAHEGNWLESRMAHLAGSFAGILKLEVPAQQTPRMLAELEKVDGLSIHVARDAIAPDDLPDETENEQLCQLEVIGQDRPGIVRQLSAALADYSVNVEELHTAIESAPMSGEPLFRARAQLLLPGNCDLANLQAVLEAIGQDLMVDVQIN